VGVCIELLGETVDSISGSEIGTRHKMGKHAAVTEIVAEKPLHGDHKPLLPGSQDSN